MIERYFIANYRCLCPITEYPFHKVEKLMPAFTPHSLPVLIGSLPLANHSEAAELIFAHTPQIPLWPQLPCYREEGMLRQFLPGFPGITEQDGRLFIDTEKDGFEEEILAFYEEYLMIAEGEANLNESRFILSLKEAKGFFTFLEMAEERKPDLIALKGQTTGPITFCTGVVDQNGRALFYNEQLRDAAVKLLAMKARWQTRKMQEISKQTLLFFDEPALAGLGSSAFITISNEEIIACFSEVFEAVRTEGGLTGVHVCANTEWSVIFDSGVDILSYDAYSYFDKLILYPDHLRNFFENGGILASGIIPTAEEYIDIETAVSLTEKWRQQTTWLEQLGIPQEMITRQTLITPSCGTGSLSEEHARKVLELTRDVSAAICG